MLLTVLRATLFLFVAGCGALTDYSLHELPYGHEICLLKAQPGRCNALNKRYFYNILTQKCEEFNYGGCDGNENNFKTKIECLAKCKVKDRRNPCYLEADGGPCRAYFRRYFYNRHTKKCEQFIYGGCFGNRNNFQTQQHCEDVCQKANGMPSDIPVICRPPADRGNCNKTMTRFFYNHLTGLCETFTYSGCGGNQNNFKRKRRCNKTCRKAIMWAQSSGASG
ncbi:carboxypeptidase inhibitor SmCI-like isoform X3 [Mobula birostris]|uniref:carboxypeptidase inhibitor SmCI-like isoform X3 n=1 Tax=Mobula birostris TaxID=1983395 RepID=UPI003B28A94E